MANPQPQSPKLRKTQSNFIKIKMTQACQLSPQYSAGSTSPSNKAGEGNYRSMNKKKKSTYPYLPMND